MSDDFQNARFQRAAYESSVVSERLVLERSKNETAALNRNLREFDAKTRKRKIRNYALIGVGSFAVGAVLSVAAFQSLGLLTLPEISYRKPEVKAQAAATPTPSSVSAVAAVPAITQATPTTPKDEPIKIVTSTPDAVVPTSTTTTVDVKKSVFQVSPVKQVAAPAAKPKTNSAIQITPNAQAKPAIIPPTKDR